MIRVGRRIGSIDPSFENFIPILCLTKSTKYGDLGPYCLKNEEGHIMENIWQFQKCYEKIPSRIERYSRYNPLIIWEHKAETHVINDVQTSEYWEWRKKGLNNEYAVRYPVGFEHRHKCLYLLKENLDGSFDRLNYIDSRKQVYVKEYCSLVKERPLFKKLLKMLEQGKNLLIIEVDGPHEESLEYYKEKYKVDNNFIENNTIICNEKNINIMLNDSKHPFGHGYALSMALLDKDEEWNK